MTKFLKSTKKAEKKHMLYRYFLVTVTFLITSLTDLANKQVYVLSILYGVKKESHSWKI